MRFLVLAYSYPPTVNPRAVRWGAIAQRWAAMGHHVDVISGWAPGQPREECHNQLHIRRVGGNLTERMRGLLRPGGAIASPKTDRRSSETQHVGRHSLKKIARACHDATWKKLYWPDSNCLWQTPAVKTAGRLLEEHRYDAVVSVSIPFTSHLVAHRLRSQMRNATWLVDVGDPFSFMDQCTPNNTALYRGKNTAWEHRIFRGSSAVSVTSDETADRYRDLFPDCADKIHVIPPLATQPCGPVNRQLQSEPLKLVYTGTLYRDIRNPRFLFELFGEMLKTIPRRGLELHLYGLVNDCSDIVATYQRKFGSALRVHGTVPPAAAQQAVANADVLINLGNSTSYQLPSKIVDYAATGKPILNLTTIDHDSSAAFLCTHPATMTVRHNDFLDQERIIRDVVGFIAAPPTVDAATLFQWMSPFTVENIADRYLQLVVPTETVQDPTTIWRNAA
ncbi:hypothetical protein CA54_40060 [Symmachiella macrocystis]|uniref:Glycosyltransferase subfamily 4-like N-terminal domain-containing protein n=1 Tax=Symmachiella macrocystis TaxID=2527985 RepID=A0A5C6BBW7_9PLAN|nr:glycosyltransferase [Symmachiella macrocystis]TWU08769.1 hypothetical protein CA54_40060 [Symmachiella macrocystis]